MHRAKRTFDIHTGVNDSMHVSVGELVMSLAANHCCGFSGMWQLRDLCNAHEIDEFHKILTGYAIICITDSVV